MKKNVKLMFWWVWDDNNGKHSKSNRWFISLFGVPMGQQTIYTVFQAFSKAENNEQNGKFGKLENGINEKNSILKNSIINNNNKNFNFKNKIKNKKKFNEK